MTNEIVTADGEVVSATAPITLFGTDNPVAIVERATVIATALADIIKRKKLWVRIGNRDHILVDGWTLLGSMLGVFAEVEWSRPIENGWEARAVARTLNGHTVGASEAMCTTSERSWKDRDAYALRSMAQTRAVSKALRLPLGFIVELAGYSATPAEELPHEQPGQAVKTVSGSDPAPAPAYRRDELVGLMRQKGMDLAAIEQYSDLVGIPRGQKATDAQMDLLIAAVTGHGTDAPLELPLGGQESDAEPPKPGTDPYRALEATDKAAARAFWAEREVPA